MSGTVRRDCFLLLLLVSVSVIAVSSQPYIGCPSWWSIERGDTCHAVAKICKTDLLTLIRANPSLGEEGGGCKFLVDGQQLCYIIVVNTEAIMVLRDDFNQSTLPANITQWSTVSFRPLAKLPQIFDTIGDPGITIEKTDDGNGMIVVSLKDDDDPALIMLESKVSFNAPSEDDLMKTSLDVQFRAKLPYVDGVVTSVFLSPSTCTLRSCLQEYPRIVLVEGAKRKNDSDLDNNMLTFQAFYPKDSGHHFQGVVTKTQPFTQNMYTDFHTFRFSASTTCLLWYVDDRLVFRTCDSQVVPRSNMNVNIQIMRAKRWINLQDISYGPVYPPPYQPASLKVDYIQVQETATLKTVVPTVTSAGTTLASLVLAHVPAAITTVNLGNSSTTESGSSRISTVVPSSNLSVILPATLVPIFVFLILIIVAILVYRKNHGRIRLSHTKRMRKQLSPASDTTTEELELSPSSVSNRPINSYSYTRWDTLDKIVRDYVRRFGVSAERIQQSSVCLGKGQFGTVHKALVEDLNGKNGTTEVAVKTVGIDRRCTFAEVQKMFEDEVRVMLQTGQHLNVVNLLGVSISEYPALLLEYCEMGSLLGYLHARRPPSDKLISSESSQNASNHSIINATMDYPTLGELQTNPLMVTSTDEQNVSTRDLMSFSYQVCRGLQYLASRSIIHRDIAARNVLLSRSLIAKVSDFGMAKYRDDNYLLSNPNQVPLPIRWMAPEAIRTMSFSFKTDVWAFGVLLWEIFTLGEVPYSVFSINGLVKEFGDWLLAGNCLEKPELASEIIYSVMKLCWALKAEERPNFGTLLRLIEGEISTESAEYYVTMNEPYEKFNAEIGKMLSDEIEGKGDQNDERPKIAFTEIEVA